MFNLSSVSLKSNNSLIENLNEPFNNNIVINTGSSISFSLKTVKVNVNVSHNNEENIQNNTNDFIDNTVTFNLKHDNSRFSNLINNYYNNNKNTVEDLHRKNIKTINNVYREYFVNKKASGFGDFIRGCYFLLQFCDKYKFNYNIIIDHPISQYLENNKYSNNFYKDIAFDEISTFENNNWSGNYYNAENNIVSFKLDDNIINDFTQYLINTKVYDSNIFIYNMCFPNETVNQSFKYIMQYVLKPNTEMTNYINATLDYLNLVKKKYNVIHIRSGDNYLNNSKNNFEEDYINTIVNDMKKHISVSYPCMLICDNNAIKKVIINYFPFIKSLNKEITHLGEGVVLESEKIKNTLLDFYLFSFSTSIKSYSSYPHGSGFSYWCSITYNIPYSCKYIE